MPIYTFKCSNEECKTFTEKFLQLSKFTREIDCPECKAVANLVPSKIGDILIERDKEWWEEG